MVSLANSRSFGKVWIPFNGNFVLALDVWRPEKVLVVRDILDLESEPLEEVLKVESYWNDTSKPKDPKPKVNTTLTAMGRPVNNHPQHPRWKHFGPLTDTIEQQAQLKDQPSM